MQKIVRFLSVFLLMVSLAYAEPTIHQVYEAAQSGNLTQAHQMVTEVLKEHPKSAKAHFVNAEILSAQGQITQARAELHVAEQLDPGLPFAKPQAIQTLKNHLSANGGIVPLSNGYHVSSYNKPFPWTMLLLLGGAALLVIFLIRSAFMRKATPQTNNFNGTSSSPYSHTTTNNPSTSTQGGGIGSGIASGLATGLAAGVGIAAGEALVNHFMHDSATPNVGNPTLNDTQQPFSDMGGNDFGVDDSSSWDDSSMGDSFSDSSGDSW